MNFSDNFFKKVEKKTNVNKEVILDLAKKLQAGNLKDKNTLKEVIEKLSEMTGKEVSKEKKEKIIEAVINDKVPKDIDKMI
ncbi:MAG: stage VI sporulation protein F [Bacilli bacterium]|nr:stage VI sporulation protein F [Bacilli bacterium]